MLAVSQHYVTTRAAKETASALRPSLFFAQSFPHRVLLRALPLVTTPHACQKLGGWVGIRRQAKFDLQGFDRLPGLQAEKSVNRADIVTGAPQARLQSLDIGK